MAKTRLLKKSTIRRALKSTCTSYAVAAAKAAKGRFAATERGEWLKSREPHLVAAAICGMTTEESPERMLNIVLDWGVYGDFATVAIERIVEVAEYRGDLPVERLIDYVEKRGTGGLDAIAEYARGRGVKLARIKELAEDDLSGMRQIAMAAAYQRKDVPLELLFEGLRDVDEDVVDEAVKAIRARGCASKTLRKHFFAMPESRVDWRANVLRVCQGRRDMLSLIEHVLEDEGSKPLLLMQAAESCQGIRFSNLDVDVWRHADNWAMNAAAMYAMVGRDDLPGEWILRTIESADDMDVLDAAYTAAYGRRDIPPVRTFEPPEYVYKKCLGDVIVKAKIPESAAVRGDLYQKCRADRAVICGVEGDFFGEPVGISRWDLTTQYRVGDQVRIRDFDPTTDDYVSGFHFYCTKDEAERDY